MTADPYKNLNIVYNHLNLPSDLSQPGTNNTITWLYDANGNKLRKEVYTDELILNGTLQDKTYRANTIRSSAQAPANSTVTLEGRDSVVIGPGSEILAGSEFTTRIDPTLVPVDQTNYIGGIEYFNGSIEAIYHPQGRAVINGSTWQHEYVITDHLGNTRLRFSDLDGSGTIDSTELLSTHDYYPFGLEWQDGGYKYTYNGKEIDRELGLNWHHYGKRMYDAVLGRFTGVDPISDQFPWVSTFNYAENEPVANIDLWGLQKFRTIDKPKDLITKTPENLAAGIKYAAEQFGGMIKKGLGKVRETLIGDINQGTPNASDFHDDGSSIRGSGFEVMTGDSELNASGTDNTPTADEGATAIIDEMFTSSGGIGKSAFGTIPERVDNTVEGVNLLREGAKKLKEGRSRPKFDELPLVRRDTFGGNIVTTRLDTFYINEKRRNNDQ